MTPPEHSECLGRVPSLYPLGGGAGVAERRTRNAIRSIRIISKLGNKSAYEYDDADVRKITAALTKEIEILKTRMSSSGGKETIEFKL
jgi:hypothetical protein